MPTPQPGQKTIPIKDWNRFLRVADWFERTVEQPPPGALRPTYGSSMIVKTPAGGIDARVGTTLSSATCIKCVAAETAIPGEKTLHETDEELVVYNTETADVAGDSYVTTTLSPNGTRYVEWGGGIHIGKLDAALDFDDATGVTFSIWTGKPASDSGINIDNVVASELLTPSGTFASGSRVKVEFIDGLPMVTGAACS